MKNRRIAKSNMPYTPKEISWLSFNARLLQEASLTSEPLIERIKFLGIFSSNLDEFFRVRVATLKRISRLGSRAGKFLGYNPMKVLRDLQTRVLEQHRRFDQIYHDLLSELAEEKIYIISEKELNEDQGKYVKAYFHNKVRRKLVPIMLDQIKNIPDLLDERIYLAVRLSHSKIPKETRQALIEIPTRILPRFLMLPQAGEDRYIMLLDDVIRYSLEDVFSVFEFDTYEAYTIKLTRDAELDIGLDLSESYIKKVSRSLKRRREGNPVRFIYDAEMPRELLNIFIRKFRLNARVDTLIPGARYHNFRDFINFPDFGNNHLKHKQLPALPHRDLTRPRSLLEAIRKRDILVHLPYQSFDYIIDLLREAAIDPQVSSIKMTIYRVARDSSVVNALINAAKNGKSVVAVLELQARFDEEANINWGTRLQEEGVNVIFGVPGLKVHSKLLLITRRRQGGLSHFAAIGTGNFNEDTSRTYSDHCLFTSDSRLTAEVYRIFEFFKKNYKTPSYSDLIVSPFNMRRKLSDLILREIENARSGKEAFIHLKLNNLVDTDIIRLLYEASQAGVQVKLNVRGMFSLIPGIEGFSENISAIGIIDRFLEHSRIFVFCNNGNPRYFISSADLMRRNLDKRVEVVCPIYDRALQKDLQTFLDIQWKDNTKARVLDKNLANQIQQNSSEEKFRAQTEIYEYLKSRGMEARKTKTDLKFYHYDRV